MKKNEFILDSDLKDFLCFQITSKIFYPVKVFELIKVNLMKKDFTCLKLWFLHRNEFPPACLMILFNFWLISNIFHWIWIAWMLLKEIQKLSFFLVILSQLDARIHLQDYLLHFRILFLNFKLLKYFRLKIIHLFIE